VTECAAF